MASFKFLVSISYRYSKNTEENNGEIKFVEFQSLIVTLNAMESQYYTKEDL